MPSQISDSLICSTASATSRLVSVFSIRSRHLAAVLAREEPVEEERPDAPDVEESRRARSHADADGHGTSIVGGAWNSARTSPRPAGSTPPSTASRRSAATASRSSRRARACGGRPPTSPRRSRRSRSAAREAGIGGVVCHALYLCNLAAPDDEIYEKSITTLRTTMDAATAIEADGVIFHVGSHLGAGLRGRPRADVAGARRRSSSAARATPGCCSRTRPAPAARSAARSRSSRRWSSASAAIRGSASASTRATCTPRATTSPTRRVDALVRQSTQTIGLDRLRALHVNDSATPLGSNRDRHANIGRGRARRGPRRLPRAPGVPAPERLPRGAGREQRGRRTRTRSRRCAPCTRAGP